MTDTADKARTFAALHSAPEILRLVNVWDAVSAKVIADLPGTRALATAGHSIAASHGYPDGEQIPLDLTIAAIARITAATELPVTVDLDSGYGDPGETARRAVGAGAVGANVEDAMKPLADSVAAVRAVIAAGEAEGVPFVLNARTDALIKGGKRPLEESIADAIERGRAYLAEGATTVFVPGVLTADTTRRLVDGIGDRKISVIGVPGNLAAAEYEALGVARISYGPLPQRVALTALKRVALDLMADGVIPADTEALN